MKFNPDDFPGNIVIQTTSREEYNKLARALDNAGRRWCTGLRYTDFFPEHLYCIDFNTGHQSSTPAYQNLGYIVLSLDDFEWETIETMQG